MEITSLKILLINHSKEVIEKGNKLFPDNRLDFNKIHFVFNLRGTTAGKASYKRMTLFYNLILAEDNLSEFFMTIIPHEIAHLYTLQKYRNYHPSVKSHGEEWKYIMKVLTGKNEISRTHSLDCSKIVEKRNDRNVTKYIYKCEKCGKLYKVSAIMHNRMQKRVYKGKLYYRVCIKCKKEVFFTGKTENYLIKYVTK